MVKSMSRAPLNLIVGPNYFRFEPKEPKLNLFRLFFGLSKNQKLYFHILSVFFEKKFFKPNTHS